MSTSPLRHCRHGHAMTVENTFWSRSGKGVLGPRCRECANAAKRRSERRLSGKDASLNSGPLLEVGPISAFLRERYKSAAHAALDYGVNRRTLECIYREDRPHVRLDLVDAICLAAGVSLETLYPLDAP
jgi:hypothetical protein